MGRRVIQSKIPRCPTDAKTDAVMSAFMIGAGHALTPFARVVLAAVALLGAFGSPVGAAPDGNRLLRLCDSEAPEDRSYCAGYISGIVKYA